MMTNESLRREMIETKVTISLHTLYTMLSTAVGLTAMLPQSRHVENCSDPLQYLIDECGYGAAENARRLLPAYVEEIYDIAGAE